MTVVGVTQRVLPANNQGERRLALDVRWARFLAVCGMVGVPLPLDPELAERTVDETGCAGLVLTGGEDLGELGGTTPERDRLERHLLGYAMGRQLPVVGVCRGMQLLTYAFGTKLIAVEGHVGTSHELTGRSVGRIVNSFHRWAAVEVPPEFEVTARSGPVVESVRFRRAPMTGLMWHPERTDPVDRSDVALFAQAFRGAT